MELENVLITQDDARVASMDIGTMLNNGVSVSVLLLVRNTDVAVLDVLLSRLPQSCEAAYVGVHDKTPCYLDTYEPCDLRSLRYETMSRADSRVLKDQHFSCTVLFVRITNSGNDSVMRIVLADTSRNGLGVVLGAWREYAECLTGVRNGFAQHPSQVLLSLLLTSRFVVYHDGGLSEDGTKLLCELGRLKVQILRHVASKDADRIVRLRTERDELRNRTVRLANEALDAERELKTLRSSLEALTKTKETMRVAKNHEAIERRVYQAACKELNYTVELEIASSELKSIEQGFALLLKEKDFEGRKKELQTELAHTESRLEELKEKYEQRNRELERETENLKRELEQRTKDWTKRISVKEKEHYEEIIAKDRQRAEELSKSEKDFSKNMIAREKEHKELLSLKETEWNKRLTEAKEELATLRRELSSLKIDYEGRLKSLEYGKEIDSLREERLKKDLELKEKDYLEAIRLKDRRIEELISERRQELRGSAGDEKSLKTSFDKEIALTKREYERKLKEAEESSETKLRTLKREHERRVEELVREKNKLSNDPALQLEVDRLRRAVGEAERRAREEEQRREAAERTKTERFTQKEKIELGGMAKSFISEKECREQAKKDEANKDEAKKDEAKKDEAKTEQSKSEKAEPAKRTKRETLRTEKRSKVEEKKTLPASLLNFSETKERSEEEIALKKQQVIDSILQKFKRPGRR